MFRQLASLFACFVLTFSLYANAAQKQRPNSSLAALDKGMGRVGQDQPDGTRKYPMPRSDMHVTVDGVSLKPGFALGSWVAFRQMHGAVEVMGDLVLAQSEVPLVMNKLESCGIDITALHNHLLNESPRVMYMHVHGNGEGNQLASCLHGALALTKMPAPAAAPASAAPPDMGFDSKQVDQVLGFSGKNNGGVYQIAIPRAQPVTEDGMPIPNSMGVATAINFQSAGKGSAAITGDFVLISSEVNPVIRALLQNGIAVTAIHSHMLDESPRLFFMHFWATGDPVKLAHGLAAALAKLDVKK